MPSQVSLLASDIIGLAALASHVLARAVRQLSTDWQRLYAHPICLVETFIDPERFRGTCYRAANWISSG